MMTERVPIVGPFTPSHIGGNAGEILFSDVFDIDYLSQTIRIPVLQWSEVKNTSSLQVEDIGCWSVWQAVQTRESRPRMTNALSLQGLGEKINALPCRIEALIDYRDKTSLLLLGLRRSKRTLDPNMTHMPTSGKSLRFSIHPAEKTT